jgi:hypothetical protein
MATNKKLPIRKTEVKRLVEASKGRYLSAKSAERKRLLKKMDDQAKNYTISKKQKNQLGPIVRAADEFFAAKRVFDKWLKTKEAKKPSTRQTSLFAKGKVLKPKRRYTKESKSNQKADSKRTAMKPGKRISKNGKVYYEYRKNRSDVKGRT